MPPDDTQTKSRPADFNSLASATAERIYRSDGAPTRLANRMRRWIHDEIVVGGQKTWRQLCGEARKRDVPFLAE